MLATCSRQVPEVKLYLAMKLNFWPWSVKLCLAFLEVETQAVPQRRSADDIGIYVDYTLVH